MPEPQTPLPAVAQGLRDITATLVHANVAIPVVIGTVTAIVAMVQALRGTAPPLAEIIEDLERQVAANRQRGEAEIARLRAQG